MKRKQIVFLLLSLPHFIAGVSSKESKDKPNFSKHDPLIFDRLTEILKSEHPNIKEIKKILASYPTIIRKDTDAELVLLCVEKDHVEILSLLLREGAVFNIRLNGYKLIQAAITHDCSVIIVQWLIRAGALQEDRSKYLTLVKQLEKKLAGRKSGNLWDIYCVLKKEIETR